MVSGSAGCDYMGGTDGSGIIVSNADDVLGMNVCGERCMSSV